MSYIRSTSNPENLYIWGDGKTTFFSKGRKDGPTPVYHMPRNVFHGLIRKWHRQYHDTTRHKGAEVKEVWIKDNGVNELKVQLSYDDWSITMWAVTWEYIAYTNLENINRGVKNKNKIIIQ